MPEIDILAILVSAVVVFLIGGAYYATLGEQLAQASEAAAAAPAQPPPWELVVELVRGLVLATVVAGLASQSEIDEWTGGLLLGVALWIGFPVVLWVGAIVHEKVPWRMAAIHAGDWLLKLLAIGVIVSLLQ